MKYKFIFKGARYEGMPDIYVGEMESFSQTKEQMFEKATILLDFCLYSEVRMFDETGRECTELY